MKNTLLALLGSILLTTPLATTAQQFGDFYYSTDGTNVAITGYFGPGGAVTIPDTIIGLPVRAIAFGFADNYSLTSITIPGSVTSIGLEVFRGCNNLTNVTIFYGLTSIGNYAFFLCGRLTSVNIPGSVIGIGEAAFRGCGSLTSVTIPGSVTNIGVDAFSNCSSLTNVTISNGVRSVGNYAFQSCSSLTNITIPGSVTNIGDLALSFCTSLMAITVDAANVSYSSVDGVMFNKSLTKLIQCPGGKAGSYLIPGSVTNLGNYAFAECRTLTTVTIPSGVTSIGASLFSGCSSLINIAIPGSVTNIGNLAFNYCTKLTNITIPRSVTDIEFGVFSSCISLKGVYFKGNRPSSFNSPLTDNTGTTVYYLPGTTGWGAEFAGSPTRLWNPLIQTSSPGFGVGPGGFGFNITGTANIPIVVESSTDLANATWIPRQSLNLTNGAFYFSDPNWANYPSRSYRVRSP